MKKVLVTGATGFIGGYVVNELLKQGCTVIATSANIHRAEAAPWFKQVTYIPFNLGQFDEPADYYTFFNRPDYMIHLAWEGLPNYKADFHINRNLPLHIAFLTNMIKHGLPDLTITGTCFEYGMQEGALREDMPTAPTNFYGQAKDGLRRFVEELQQSHSFIFKWVRLFYMYGKGQNPNSLLSQLDKALEANEPVFNMSGGGQVRDYLPVTTVANYIVQIALQKKVSGIINCCSGKPITVKQFVLDYLKEKNKSITLNLGFYPYPDYEPMRFWGDNSKLKTIVKQ